MDVFCSVVCTMRCKGSGISPRNNRNGEAGWSVTLMGECSYESSFINGIASALCMVDAAEVHMSKDGKAGPCHNSHLGRWYGPAPTKPK